MTRRCRDRSSRRQARRSQLRRVRFPESLHQPANQPALEADAGEAVVAEDVADLGGADGVALVREAPLGEQREAQNEQRERGDEEQNLEQPLAQARTREVLRVGLPVERRLAVVERVLRLPPAL